MISVIGAGPAGSFYASKEKNDDIILFEEDKDIGKIVSCTGIVTDSIKDIMKLPKDVIVNKIKGYNIISPNNKKLFIKLKKPDIIINRTLFDQHIFEKAIDNGAKPHLNERFLNYQKVGKSKYLIKTNKRTYYTDMIVGADGPKSRVATSAGMIYGRKFIHGLQARCKHQNKDSSIVDIHLNNGEFSWVVPEDDNVARIGVVGSNINTLKSVYSKIISKSKIIETQSGLIPLYNQKQEIRRKNENIFLLGDAATHVKATTYGGIIYGLIAGNLLAENKETYEKRSKNIISKELWLSLKIRQLMNKMSDKQVNDLLNIFSKKENAELIGQFDRNYPSKFILKLILKEPRLIGLGLRILI
jgi:digeranylgeranylglycerophospholipid reductase